MHQKIHDVHFQCLIVSGLDTLFLKIVIKAFCLCFQIPEYPHTIGQMLIAVLIRRGPHRFHIKSDIFSVVAVTVLLQHLDLIEGLTKVLYAEGLILIITDAVLVIQMNGEQLMESQSKSHFVRRVKA